MARYHEIADDLRARIKAGEWKVGEKLPGISALQEHYKVEKSLGTVRSAQQLLVADGMLRTEQGVGAFVIATKPMRRVDVGAVLADIRDLANDGLLGLLQSELDAKRGANGKVTFDLMDDDRLSVLETALRNFATQCRREAQDADEPAAKRISATWADTAEQMLAQIEAALT